MTSVTRVQALGINLFKCTVNDASISDVLGRYIKTGVPGLEVKRAYIRGMQDKNYRNTTFESSSDNADAQFEQQMPSPNHEKTQEQEGGGGPIVPFPPTGQEQSRF